MEGMNDQKFEKAHIDAEEVYKKLNEVWCPYFKEKITFNSKGWEHLRFSRIRHARARQDQYVRLRLISIAPQIINTSHTLQGVSTRKNMEREKGHGKWSSIMRVSTYYEFVAIINGYRIRVIVKQVEDGPKYFWSIIPFWKMDKITGQRLMYSGKPETD